MRRLLLLRHAKSDWNAPYEGDHERPLKRRGTRAARLMGRFIADTGHAPQLVVSSSAVRARTTAELAAAAGGWACAIRIEPGLYDASCAGALDIVRALPNDVDIALLAGHEPTFSELTGRLVGQGRVRLPTAAVACIDLAVERWVDADFGCGALVWLMPPRLLQAGGSAG